MQILNYSRVKGVEEEKETNFFAPCSFIELKMGNNNDGKRE